jgi:hypothetical protein
MSPAEKPKDKAAAPGPKAGEPDRKALRKQARLALRLERPGVARILETAEKKNTERATLLLDLLIQEIEVRARPATAPECDYIYEVMRKDAVEYFEKSGLEKSLWQNIGS